METGVIYYSYSGNTKRYVEKISDYLECELIEIKAKDEIKVKGFKSYIVCGRKVLFKEVPELLPYDFNADDYEFIIFASPVWAFTYAPALRAFFEKEKIKNKKVSYFSTHQGGPGKINKYFEEALEGNDITKGTNVNIKKSDEINMKIFEEWIERIKRIQNKG